MKKVWTAGVALAMVAVLAGPMQQAAADDGSLSRERYDRAVAGRAQGPGGADAGAANEKAGAAATTTGTDPTGDALDCRGDIASYSVTYDHTVTAAVHPSCAVDPATDNHWYCSVDFCTNTAIVLLIDVDGDNAEDYAAFVGNDFDNALFSEVYDVRDGAFTKRCDATAQHDTSPKIQIAFPPFCIGSPANFRYLFDYIWDDFTTSGTEECVCSHDFAPNNENFGAITWRNSPPSTTSNGYWMLGAGGAVYPFGPIGDYGDAPAWFAEAVDIEATANSMGYWVLHADGKLHAFGNAPSFRISGLAAGERAVSISGTKDSNGLYVFTDRGRAIVAGNAVHRGDMTGTPLNGAILDSIVTASGNGYYMVGSDGGIFSYGDAAFHGSMGGRPLNQPVVGIAPDPDNVGYWLVASDGGTFSFNANFNGSMGGVPLNQPVIGMVSYGNGYLMVASDGGIFNFSNKAFYGSLAGQPLPAPITSVTPAR